MANNYIPFWIAGWIQELPHRYIEPRTQQPAIHHDYDHRTLLHISQQIHLLILDIAWQCAWHKALPTTTWTISITTDCMYLLAHKWWAASHTLFNFSSKGAHHIRRTDIAECCQRKTNNKLVLAAKIPTIVRQGPCLDIRLQRLSDKHEHIHLLIEQQRKR